MSEPTTVIIGMGATGLSCARFLAARGDDFMVMDSRDNPPNLPLFASEFGNTSLFTGRLEQACLGRAQRLVVSPGVSIAEPVIQHVMNQGTEVIGDIELFARYANAPVIAITGANGKSTVTTLVGEMAKAAGLDVRVGGNLGTPALDLLTTQSPDLYVLELSSFQLETTYTLNATAATVLNITPDHMDRYSSIDEYAAAKQRIFKGDGVMVINSDDPLVAAMSQLDRKIIRFSMSDIPNVDYKIRKTHQIESLFKGEQTLLSSQDLRIKGRHNLVNALAALALGEAFGLPLSVMLTTLREFPGLSHRCQWVGSSSKGIGWYNDSKGTNVGATCAAIRGLASKKNLVLIAGGDGKGADFTDLIEPVEKCVRSVVLLGRDAPIIAKVLNQIVPVYHVSDMDEAVNQANTIAMPGDIVLLSPACASLDMYKNYVERGEVFVRAVRKIGVL